MTTQQITPGHAAWPTGGHLNTMLDLGSLAKIAIARLQLNAERCGIVIPDEATLLAEAEEALDGMAVAGNLCDLLLRDLCEVMSLSVDGLQELRRNWISTSKPSATARRGSSCTSIGPSEDVRSRRAPRQPAKSRSARAARARSPIGAIEASTVN